MTKCSPEIYSNFKLYIALALMIITSSCNKYDLDRTNPLDPYGDNYEGTTVTDSDGNVYNYVTIGTQVWMKENLKTTKYNNGTIIPNITDNTSWSNLTTAGYSWYENNILFKEPYGALYNWYAVSTGKVCPPGWHVPSDAEWTILTDYLGGEVIAGGKMKELGTMHWLSPNNGATDESGFTAVPSGLRDASTGIFANLHYDNIYWSSTQFNVSEGLSRFLRFDGTYCNGFNDNKRFGFSVRCLKD